MVPSGSTAGTGALYDVSAAAWATTTRFGQVRPPSLVRHIRIWLPSDSPLLENRYAVPAWCGAAMTDPRSPAPSRTGGDHVSPPSAEMDTAVAAVGDRRDRSGVVATYKRPSGPNAGHGSATYVPKPPEQ